MIWISWFSGALGLGPAWFLLGFLAGHAEGEREEKLLPGLEREVLSHRTEVTP